MNKNSYLAITIEENKKFVSYTLKISNCNNLVSVLAGIKGLKTVNICDSKKECDRIVKAWNEAYKHNGTYLYSN